MLAYDTIAKDYILNMPRHQKNGVDHRHSPYKRVHGDAYNRLSDESEPMSELRTLQNSNNHDTHTSQNTEEHLNIENIFADMDCVFDSVMYNDPQLCLTEQNEHKDEGNTYDTHAHRHNTQEISDYLVVHDIDTDMPMSLLPEMDIHLHTDTYPTNAVCDHPQATHTITHSDLSDDSVHNPQIAHTSSFSYDLDDNLLSRFVDNTHYTHTDAPQIHTVLDVCLQANNDFAVVEDFNATSGLCVNSLSAKHIGHNISDNTTDNTENNALNTHAHTLTHENNDGNNQKHNEENAQKEYTQSRKRTFDEMTQSTHHKDEYTTEKRKIYLSRTGVVTAEYTSAHNLERAPMITWDIPPHNVRKDNDGVDCIQSEHTTNKSATKKNKHNDDNTQLTHINTPQKINVQTQDNNVISVTSNSVDNTNVHTTNVSVSHVDTRNIYTSCVMDTNTQGAHIISAHTNSTSIDCININAQHTSHKNVDSTDNTHTNANDISTSNISTSESTQTSDNVYASTSHASIDDNVIDSAQTHISDDANKISVVEISTFIDLHIQSLYSETEENEKYLIQAIVRACKLAQFVKPEDKEVHALTFDYTGDISFRKVSVFSRLFPQRKAYICDHGRTKQCCACTVIKECDAKVNGDTILRQLIMRAVRIPRLCSATSVYMLLLNEYSVFRYTRCHDKYMYNIRDYILSSDDFNNLITQVHGGILEYHALLHKQPKDSVYIHENNAKALQQYDAELTKLFLHMFVSKIKETAVQACIAAHNDELISRPQPKRKQSKYDTTPESASQVVDQTCLDTIFDKTTYSPFHKVELNTYAMKRDMLEYSDRVKYIKRNILEQRNRAFLAVARPPFLSCAFLLLSTNEIFNIVLKHKRFIPEECFVPVTRRARASARCACRVRLANFKSTKSNTNIMEHLDVFTYSTQDRNERKTSTTHSDILLETKKYVQVLYNIRDCIHSSEYTALVEECMGVVNRHIFTISVDGTNQQELKRKIFALIGRIHGVLKTQGFTIANTPKYRYSAYTSAVYGSLSMQDISDQAVVLDALDVSLLHTFHIFKQSFRDARNIMLHVILNIWFLGSQGEHDLNLKDLNDVIKQYDEALMSNFIKTLTKIQERKASNLHTLLPYELHYLRLIESKGCKICDILQPCHYAHYVNPQGRDVCVSLLIIEDTVSAMLSLLDDVYRRHISIGKTISQDCKDGGDISRKVTSRLLACDLRESYRISSNALTRRLYNVLYCLTVNY